MGNAYRSRHPSFRGSVCDRRIPFSHTSFRSQRRIAHYSGRCFASLNMTGVPVRLGGPAFYAAHGPVETGLAPSSQKIRLVVRRGKPRLYGALLQCMQAKQYRRHRPGSSRLHQQGSNADGRLRSGNQTQHLCSTDTKRPGPMSRGRARRLRGGFATLPTFLSSHFHMP